MNVNSAQGNRHAAADLALNSNLSLLREPGCPLKTTLKGGTGPVCVMLIPNCVRSWGVMQLMLGAVGAVHWTLPCPNRVWKMAAEVSVGGAPGTPVRGTNTWAIWRTP